MVQEYDENTPPQTPEEALRVYQGGVPPTQEMETLPGDPNQRPEFELAANTPTPQPDTPGGVFDPANPPNPAVGQDLPQPPPPQAAPTQGGDQFTAGSSSLPDYDPDQFTAGSTGVPEYNQGRDAYGREPWQTSGRVMVNEWAGGEDSRRGPGMPGGSSPYRLVQTRLGLQQVYNAPRQRSQAPATEGPPPGYEQGAAVQPWHAHGDFKPTPAQLEVQRVHEQGGRVTQDMYETALRDRQAQREGMPWDWRPTQTEIAAIQREATFAAQAIPDQRHRPAFIAGRVNDALHMLAQNKHSSAVKYVDAQRAAAKQAHTEQESRSLATFKSELGVKAQAAKAQETTEQVLRRRKEEQTKAATERRTYQDTRTKDWSDEWRKRHQAAADAAVIPKGKAGEGTVDWKAVPEHLRDEKGMDAWVADKVDEDMAKHSPDENAQAGYAELTKPGGLPRNQAGAFDYSKFTPQHRAALKKFLDDPYSIGLTKKRAKAEMAKLFPQPPADTGFNPRALGR